MIRPSRAYTRVFPDRNYRVWKEFRAHYSLEDGLEIVWWEVDLVWKIFTMVWRWSDQRSIWSEKSDQTRLRAQLGLIITSSSALLSDQRQLRTQLGLIITSSSALGSDQKCFWTQLGLIRDHFEAIIFSFFFVFFYWKMLALPRGS